MVLRSADQHKARDRDRRARWVPDERLDVAPLGRAPPDGALHSRHAREPSISLTAPYPALAYSFRSDGRNRLRSGGTPSRPVNQSTARSRSRSRVAFVFSTTASRSRPTGRSWRTTASRTSTARRRTRWGGSMRSWRRTRGRSSSSASSRSVGARWSACDTATRGLTCGLHVTRRTTEAGLAHT